MIQKNRDFYLEHLWEGYPLPQPSGECGRLIKHEKHEVNDFYIFEFTDQYGKKNVQNLNLTTALWFGENQDLIPRQVLAQGDWVQVWGHQTGPEVSITNNSKFETKLIVKVLLLAPCLTKDQFVISNQNTYRKWILFLEKIRLFFARQNFDEIKTPTLVICPGTEPFIEPFVTEFKFGQFKQKFFLPTSPELSLKRCLARGWSRVFEIRPCFRNGEKSELHLSEFYMLEWYRSFENLNIIKNDIICLLEELQFEGWSRTLLKSFSMADLFKRFLQFDLTPKTTVAELSTIAFRLGLKVSSDWDFDDVFHLLYVERIEPELRGFEFLFLENYPPSQAALARLTPDGWGERFEFYIKGVEIANAFHELNDPRIQRQRFEEDLAKKKKNGMNEIPLDEDFLTHLEQGLPPASGIALGLERLFMMMNGIKDIKKITPF